MNVSGVLSNGYNALNTNLNSLYQNSSYALQQNLIKAEQQNVKTTNAFNAQEAAKDRAFQQASAEKAQKFEADQAALNRSWNAAEAEKARQYEIAENQKNRDYNTEMSNTQYQRAVEDLKKAGLNPILAYQGLNGNAPTYSGSVTAQASSGSYATGKTASGSRASGTKADIIGAYNAIFKTYDQLVPILAATVLSNTAKDIKESVNEVKDKVSSTVDKAKKVAKNPKKAVGNAVLAKFFGQSTANAIQSYVGNATKFFKGVAKDGLVKEKSGPLLFDIIDKIF